MQGEFNPRLKLKSDAYAQMGSSNGQYSSGNSTSVADTLKQVQPRLQSQVGSPPVRIFHIIYTQISMLYFTFHFIILYICKGLVGLSILPVFGKLSANDPMPFLHSNSCAMELRRRLFIHAPICHLIAKLDSPPPLATSGSFAIKVDSLMTVCGNRKHVKMA